MQSTIQAPAGRAEDQPTLPPAQSAPAHAADALPLLIGVTGHRDLRAGDLDVLAMRVRGVFDQIRRLYPHTPLILLDSLAEGADRLVARVALECGVRLIAPLPMSPALYRDDFATPESRAEFDALLARADQWFALPPVADSTEATIAAPGPARDRQYAQAGAYLALQSQLLIALWNGQSSELVGGTADTVRMQLEGVGEPYGPPRRVLDPVDAAPVYHIVTPRESDAAPVADAFAVRVLFPSGYATREAAIKAYDRTFGRLDAFNRDALRLAHQLAPARPSSLSQLPGDDRVADLPAVTRAELRLFRERFAVADTLAVHFQRLTVRTMRGLFLLALLVVFGFAGLKFKDPEPVVMAIGLAMLTAGYIWYLGARRGDYQSKYLDYRALAEGLRVQFYWRLAGVRDSVADHYLRKQRTELDWIRNTLRVQTRRAADTAGVAGHTQTWPQLILDAWVADQAAYFERAARRAKLHLGRLRQWSYGLFLVGVALAVTHEYLAAKSAGAFGDLVRFMSLLPLALAAVHGYARLRPLTAERRGLIGAAAGAAVKDASEPASLRIRANLLFGFALVLLLGAVLLTVLVPPPAESATVFSTLDWLVVVMTLATASSALLQGYADKMALSAHSNQYGRMATLFAAARDRLRAMIAAGDEAGARTVVRELGQEALAENGDWVILHRERPLEMPKG